MIVAVGSLNKVKIAGVKRAYSKIFSSVKVVGIKVSSGVSPQPLNLEETVEGAFNRALKALSSLGEADHGVGIEAGWMKIKNVWVDVQVAAIVDRKGRRSLGFSPAFPLPKILVDRVLSQAVEMEDVMVEISGVEAIGEKEGAIGFFTKNLVTREDLTYYATLMALLPYMPWNSRVFREL